MGWSSDAPCTAKQGARHATHEAINTPGDLHRDLRGMSPGGRPAPLFAADAADQKAKMVMAVVTYHLPRPATLADVKRAAAGGA